MGYLIAAYGVVIGSLLGYGLWIQLQRRSLSQPPEPSDGSGDADSPKR